MKVAPFTVVELRSRLAYDPLTGIFTWLKCKKPCLTGKPAGGVNGSAHIQICIDGQFYQAHRLAWFYMTGDWPQHLVDHKDRDPANNRWKNLRLASHGQNRSNSRATGKSGIKGVYPEHQKWRAIIRHEKKAFNLGLFVNKADAAAAYRSAAERLHGEFACP